MKFRVSVVVFCAVFAVASIASGQRSTPVQLINPAGAASDEYGSTVAVDGDTMIVAGVRDDLPSNVRLDSVHVFRWSGAGWVFESTLAATGGAAGDSFGSSVAISGDTVVVGAPSDDVGSDVNRGAAYVFTRSGTTWTQQAQLVASDGFAGDFFANSVAISGDTVVVGAAGDDVGTTAVQGSAYVFTRVGNVWTQQAQLVASDGADVDQFGSSVAISADTVIVGAWLDDIGGNSDQGSAYVFTRSGAIWTQQAQLTAADGAAGDSFGYSVALSSDAAIVGAFADDVGSNVNQGSVYAFTRSGTTWTQQAKLLASDGAADDVFGSSLALSGDTVIVGAPQDDVGTNLNQGSARVFTRAGTLWTQRAFLTAPDGTANDLFGRAVALSGDTSIVGAAFDDVGPSTNQGTAWVFSRVGRTWIGPDLTLLASDGATDDELGISVAISGDTAILGAHQDDVGANFDQGSAYVFVRRGLSWIQQAKLLASDGAANDAFGYSVAISGDTAIVGAYLDAVGANLNQGSAYVFVRSGSTWTQQAKLLAIDGEANNLFGYSVAISGDTAIIGAVAKNFGLISPQGAAYVFARAPGGVTWTQKAQLIDTGGAAGDLFGYSVSLAGDTAIVGATGVDDLLALTVNQGAAFVFVGSGASWTQQAKLTATGGASNDSFGASVAIEGDTAVVGVPKDDVGSKLNQGSACVFVRSGTSWSQQAQLTASDGEALDEFGNAVALSGETVLVGAWCHVVGTNFNQGSAYAYARSGTAWTQQAQLTAHGSGPNTFFGSSVAMWDGTAIVGAFLDNVGVNTTQGSARIFDGAVGDFAVAHNDVTNISYPTLSAAMLPALSTHEITASEAAWRTLTTLDNAGRSLILRSSGDLRIPSTSAISLGGSSSLNVGSGDTVAVFGQLRVSSFASLNADSFLLGSRGTLTVRSSAGLTINTPVATLQGQTRLENSAWLAFSGPVETIGPVTAGLGSSLTSGGIFSNIDTFTISGGTLNMAVFFNRARANFFGSSQLNGSYFNNTGAITNIRSGTLTISGNLTNDGTIVGTICTGCLSSPPAMKVGGDLVIGPASSLAMPFPEALVRVGGDFDCSVNSNTRYDMRLATLGLEGDGSEQRLEVMSKDIGTDPAGLDRAITGHYPIHTLHIGPAAAVVQLVDNHDNDGVGRSAREAIYVDTLLIDAGGRLSNASGRIYYNRLINKGIIDVPANVIKLRGACAADVNADGFLTFEDFDAFVAALDAGAAGADFNGDGLLTFEDFDAFVAQFEVGC